MQIIPIRDLRDTNKISELCNNTNEPIFITKNGYGDMVVMSIKTYEEKMKKIEIYENVIKSLKELEENKTVDGPMVINDIETKYGL